jgi:IclR family pca regulon transcriptional regulator
MRDPDKDIIAGFGKGLAIIEAFGAGGASLTITQAAERTGLERATARRCLLTLVRAGYAEYDGKFFRLTPRILRLGFAYLAATPLPRLVQPFLEQLSADTGESCSASILDDLEIVYVARASQRRVMSIGLALGSRLPAYCASMGRVLLAALPAAEARRRIAATPLRAMTARTITDPQALMEEISKVAETGYCVVDEELEIGLRSIAVPLRDRHGKTIAALNLGVQAGRVAASDMADRFLPRLVAAQRDLAALLG